MAEINIQRKKSSPSPWLLVLLAAVLLGVGAYFFLRPAPADEPTPAVGTSTSAPVSVVPSDSAAQRAIALAQRSDSANQVAAPATDADATASLAAQAATSPAAPNYALHGLQKLTGVLVALADRDDLRDPTITEQRDNLTSATSRLGEANASLRPGFVAAAGLIRVMQQKAYPDLEDPAADLVRQAAQLSGRSATTADQQLNQQFLTQAAAAVRVLSEPAQ